MSYKSDFNSVYLFIFDPLIMASQNILELVGLVREGQQNITDTDRFNLALKKVMNIDELN